MRFKQFLIEYDQNSPQREVNIGNRDFAELQYTDYDNGQRAGHFSRVRPTKDEHIVRKQSKDPEKAKIDGYWIYVNQLVRSASKDNPYFPRLYNIKTYKNNKNDIMYKADIEKLESVDDIESDMLISYIEKLTSIPLDGTKFKFKFQRKDYLIDFLAWLFKQVILGNLKSNDDALNDAGIFIKNVKKEHDLMLDVDGKDNFMFRIGKYGIQAVFTDPLGD